MQAENGPVAAATAIPTYGNGGSAPAPAGLLPDSAYSSLDFQAMEDAAIWSRLWVCTGFAAEIPDAGDILPFTVGHQGIHIERRIDGSLIGRFNKAQHGGCRVVPLQCRTGTKTRCSFTACGHSRDRGPIRAADPDGALQLDQYLGLRPERLLPVAVETWGPLLLAKLDPRDEAATRDWPTVRSVFGGDEVLSSDETIWRDVSGNWKTVAMRLAGSGRFSDDDTALLFPNVVVRRSGAGIEVVILQPIALDRTLCRIRVFGAGDSPMEYSSAQTVDAPVREVELASTDTIAIRDDAFERAVAKAMDVLGAEAPTGPLFRTDAKGQW